MPSRTEQLLESIAWRTLDEFIRHNPKPRLTARMKHRAKIWIRSTLSSNVNISEVNHNDYFYPMNDRDGEVMLEYAERTIDD